MYKFKEPNAQKIERNRFECPSAESEKSEIRRLSIAAADSLILADHTDYVRLQSQVHLVILAIFPIILIIAANQNPFNKSSDNLQEVWRSRHIMSPTELVNLDINAILC